ncbi:MAG: cation diffusion facilitator family transporter [Desulfobulbaceae bacterium]|jgi:cobalt-zinc-cadmium efflux system protein|nr:cation diffusion facilitator family transporter [Desulfobulbaceae bacterium]
MSPSHNHSHTPARFDRAFAIGTALNLGFVVIEATYGILGNSLALVADAGHNLSDVMGLLLAWGASVLARKAATASHTFGFKKATILASLFSALMLYGAVGIIVWEAVQRLLSPLPVEGFIVIVVAGIGVVINTATALLFFSGRKDDLNIKGAFLHMAADAVVSVGVVAAGFAIRATGLLWIDPALSIIIAVIIIIASWGLLKDSLHLSMAGVPGHIDPETVLSFLEELPGVHYVHDLHIWAASTTENILTAHLVMPEGGDDVFLDKTAQELLHHFDIHHATLQIEHDDCCAVNNHEAGSCWPKQST